MKQGYRVFVAGYLFLLFSSFTGAFIKPVGFQKSASIKESDPRKWDGIERGEIDIASFIAGIPSAKKSGGTIYEVEPERKFNETIRRGQGDCSNMVFGAAWYLDQHHVDYAIVYLLHEETFLEGKAHTLLRVRYLIDGGVRRGLVDIVGGGLPLSRNRYITIHDLEGGGLLNLNMRHLNSQPTSDDTQYFGRFLDQAEIGYVPGWQVNRYFKFIRAVYIPLGSAKVEKYLYDGLAVLSGMYPTVYVKSIADLYGRRLWMRYYFLTSAWIMRSALFVMPWIMTTILLRIRSMRRAKRLMNSTIRMRG
jgi:hypothetical protein